MHGGHCAQSSSSDTITSAEKYIMKLMLHNYDPFCFDLIIETKIYL